MEISYLSPFPSCARPKAWTGAIVEFTVRLGRPLWPSASVPDAGMRWTPAALRARCQVGFPPASWGSSARVAQLHRWLCQLQRDVALTRRLVRGTLPSRSQVRPLQVARCLHALLPKKTRPGVRTRRPRVQVGRKLRRGKPSPLNLSLRSLMPPTLPGFRGASATSRSAEMMQACNRAPAVKPGLPRRGMHRRSPGRYRRSWK
jgi:hypothetical protein